MPSRSWIFHTVKLLLFAAAVWFVGWMAGYPVVSLAIAALVFAGWHSANLIRLHRWTMNPGSETPESFGFWAEIFNSINSIQKSHLGQQENLQAALNELRSLTDVLPDAMLVVNTEGIISWSNAAAERLLNLKIAGRIGKSIFSLLRDPEFGEWLAVQAEVKSPLDIPSPQGGGRWLTVSAFTLTADRRLIVLRNITGIQNLEQIRRDFVANVSHELRTPLTVLRGYLELLDDHPATEVNEAVDRMLVQALQMQTLLDDLLELSRLQSLDLRGEDELIDIPRMMTRIREQAEDLSRDEHRIRFDVNPQLFMTGVPSDLKSAFSNLVTNAIKYTPKGGSIEVIWELGPQGPQLRVRDTGIGIPNRDIPRVTERFYRVGSDRARETGGTGLGLAIVKHVLYEHQARLTITSELGLGSEFTCTFPGERAKIQPPG